MKSAFIKFYHLNRMGRIEGPPLAGVLLLCGAAYSTGSISLNIWFAAGLMFFLCMNYVYLVNGVTDVEEDSINSPDRPLASGLVNKKLANNYVWLLFFLTLLYPLFVHVNWSEKLIVWVILAMGYFYSNPPVRFKRYPPLATLYLVLNFNLPLVLGYWMVNDGLNYPPFLMSTSLLFLSNMPLKDYGDRVGDAKAGVPNWVQLAGSTRSLLLISSSISIAGAIACYFLLPQMKWRMLFVVLPLLPLVNICLHGVFRLNMDKMFTRGVRLLIFLGAVFTLIRLG